MQNIFLSGYLLGNVYKNLGINYQYIDYLSYNSYEDLKKDVKGEYNVAIGYSLGGRILLRLISEGHIKVKKLYIVGAPYYVHSTPDFPYGMKVKTFRNLRHLITGIPEIIFNSVLKLLYNVKLVPSPNWSREKIKYWYGFLAEYFPIKTPYPETIIIHGKKDFIVDFKNATYLQKKLKAKLIPLDTGHIIFPSRLKKFIKEF
ncbi:MAG: hypothetical protein J0H68_02035 [Sphingobacteriia bacterium]|nr:hypothetical protein [Sphingobacteriia bacterium]